MMAEQQIQKKKNKKRRETLLLTDYECLTTDEILSSVADMRKSLVQIFRKHIGEENSISPVDLFRQVYGVDPSYLDIFKKNYWWNILKGILRGLRRDDSLFVINKGTKLFVLSSQKEADDFKNKMDREIVTLKVLKIKADAWVKKKRWKNI